MRRARIEERRRRCNQKSCLCDVILFDFSISRIAVYFFQVSLFSRRAPLHFLFYQTHTYAQLVGATESNNSSSSGGAAFISVSIISRRCMPASHKQLQRGYKQQLLFENVIFPDAFNGVPVSLSLLYMYKCWECAVYMCGNMEKIVFRLLKHGAIYGTKRNFDGVHFWTLKLLSTLLHIKLLYVHIQHSHHTPFGRLIIWMSCINSINSCLYFPRFLIYSLQVVQRRESLRNKAIPFLSAHAVWRRRRATPFAFEIKTLQH